MFVEVLKGLIPLLVITGILAFALAPVDDPVFDWGRVNQGTSGK